MRPIPVLSLSPVPSLPIPADITGAQDGSIHASRDNVTLAYSAVVREHRRHRLNARGRSQ